MSVYGFTVTTAGEALLAQAAGSGQALVITGTQVGSGVVEDAAAAKALTALLSPQQAGTYSTPQINGGQISLIVEYRNNLNGGLTSGFSLNEFGIFARVGAGQATLLAYGSLGDSPAPVHPIADGLETYRYPVAMAFSGDLEVTVEDPSGAFVTDDQLAQYVPLSQKGQPGGVAGLDSSGKVPEEQLPDMDYLPLAGGTMAGVIAMGGYKITGLGAPSASSDAARLQEVNSIFSTVNAGWVLLDELATPGSGTWTVPDPFGDGQPYQIGVLVIGAGGSGGAAASMSNIDGSDRANGYASGGASGYMVSFIMTVTPGQTINYVVGAKGAAVTAKAGDAPLDRSGHANGNNGGASSFNGVTADGGEGGHALAANTDDNTYSVDGARGAQCSVYIEGQPSLPADGAWGGKIVNISGERSDYSIGFDSIDGYNALNCWNPFESRKMLCSGGGAMARNDLGQIKGIGGTDPISQIAGHGASKGGNAAALQQDQSSPSSVSREADSATGNGNGGGACAIALKVPNVDWPTATAISGAGADGAIWIYIQGKKEESA